VLVSVVWNGLLDDGRWAGRRKEGRFVRWYRLNSRMIFRVFREVMVYGGRFR